jgi:SAM-dependent methyltransferase
MVDEHFEQARLVAIYDALDPDRRDLEPYLDLVAGLGARRVLDLGCGTGVFALLLAERGLDVIGVDPAGGSLDVARAKPGAERVRWIHGDAASLVFTTSLPLIQVDVVTMTGNAAQAIIDPDEWQATLRGVYQVLKPSGSLVFETRDPAFRGWEEWTRAASERVTDIPGVGPVRTWVELTEVRLPLVSFRSHFVFESDEAASRLEASSTLTSDSTLRFRERSEVEADLEACGLTVDDVRAAPDRPGREFVFLAHRP